MAENKLDEIVEKCTVCGADRVYYGLKGTMYIMCSNKACGAGVDMVTDLVYACKVSTKLKRVNLPSDARPTLRDKDDQARAQNMAADMIEKVRQEYKTEVARLTKLVWDFINGYRHCGKPLETRMIESGYPKPAAAPQPDHKCPTGYPDGSGEDDD